VEALAQLDAETILVSPFDIPDELRRVFVVDLAAGEAFGPVPVASVLAHSQGAELLPVTAGPAALARAIQIAGKALTEQPAAA
jgi:hypothetical protein